MNPLKQALMEGRRLIGTSITIPSVEIAALMAASRFDFIWIEMEHSPITLETARAMILATRGLQAVPITRVPVNETWLAKRVMDIGSFGVVFPSTTNRALAEQAVASTKYPPVGVRGFGPSMAAFRWGLTIPDYVKAANDNVLVMPLVEEIEAVEAIETIVDVPGIDILMIGANDLSFSMGLGGQLTHPDVVKAVDRVIAAAARRGIPVGHPASSATDVRQLTDRGVRVFQLGSDVMLLRKGVDAFWSEM